MGQRFLWADRYCIDQNNHALRAEQISSMDSIYEQAWLTLTCLGPDDQSGLPGVSLARHEPATVRLGEFDITILITNLQATIRHSVYNSRAWALQVSR